MTPLFILQSYLGKKYNPLHGKKTAQKKDGRQTSNILSDQIRKSLGYAIIVIGRIGEKQKLNFKKTYDIKSACLTATLDITQ